MSEATKARAERRSAAIMVGYLGGFTTFSSFVLETLRLFQDRQWVWALAYWVGSPVLGVIAAFLGIRLADLIT